MIIGFIHYRKKPVGLNKAYACAVVAQAEGAELLFFSPGAIDFKTKKIDGYMYRNGEWVEVTSRFPDVIYNSVKFSKDKQNSIADKLSREIPFTSHSIGSKMTVYNDIKKYKEFANYLIPSEKVLSVKHFYGLLDKYRKIVFKPSFGRQGVGVYYIKRMGSFYEVLSGYERTAYDYDGMSDFILAGISDRTYLIQPYINCRTKSGNSYDFRLHVQKNIKGEWVTTQIYPRIAEKGSIVCNICSGGYTGDLNLFLKSEFGEDHFNIKNYIEKFALQLAAHIDKIQKELYNEDLDELGIDIGLDENRKICLYEINSRPGHPPSMSVDLSLIKNEIHYAMFLAGKKK